MNRSTFVALALAVGFSASPVAASTGNQTGEANHVRRVAWTDHDHDRDAARDHHLKREELHRDHRLHHDEAARHRQNEQHFRADEHRRDDRGRREHERHEKHLPPGQAKKLSEHHDRDHHGA